MKPLIVLLTIFGIGYLVKRLFKLDKLSVAYLAKFAMSSMLVFTGIGHFVFAEGMAEMLPEIIPFKIEIIYGTGILEIIGAIALLMPDYSRWAGIGLILFLIAILPTNIYAALHHINPITGALDGPGSEYLLFRIPLQVFFIIWIYISSVRSNQNQLSIFKNQVV